MKTVVIIGGGAAGIASAVSAAEKGWKAILCESTPRLGGRLGSYYEPALGVDIDYGEHLLTAGYTETLTLLEKIGASDALKIQESLQIPFYSNRLKPILLQAPRFLPTPVDFVFALQNFKLLSLPERLKMTARLLKLAKEDIPLRISARQYLQNASPNEFNCFWKPFIISALNTIPEEADMNMVKTALMKGFVRKGGLVFFKQPQKDVFHTGAMRYLKSVGVEVRLNSYAVGIDATVGRTVNFKLKSGEVLNADALIFALPPEKLGNIAGMENVINMTPDFVYSPICSVVLVFRKRIFPTDFGCLLNSAPQWFFYKGICRGKISGEIYHLVISAADKTIPAGIDLVKTCISDLRKCGAEFGDDEVLFRKLIMFRRATVRLTHATGYLRPSNRTLTDNVFLAGDWVNTGLPATIESAVMSGKNAAGLL